MRELLFYKKIYENKKLFFEYNEVFHEKHVLKYENFREP